MLYGPDGKPLTTDARPVLWRRGDRKFIVRCYSCKVPIQQPLITVPFPGPHAVVGSCPKCGRKVRKGDKVDTAPCEN